MAALATTNPTLLDLAKMTDPDGKIAPIVEILNQTNEVLDDMTFQEGNLPTGHRSVIRTGLPAVTWRKLYGGVQPSRATTRPVTDATGMLWAYAEVDKTLADLNNNTAAFRLQQDSAQLESMSQEMADTTFYGNEGTAPEKFTGLAPRFNTVSTATSASAENVIDAGGTGTDNTSIWLVVWSPTTVFGIFPKGMKAGFQMLDKGLVTVENADGAGGRMEAYRTVYEWHAGLVVQDWRYVVRICNIDKSDLSKTFATGADLVDLMIQAQELIPNLNKGRPVFYVSRAIRSMLRRQATKQTGNSTLSLETLGGKHMTMLNGIPIKRVDRLATDEARVV